MTYDIVSEEEFDQYVVNLNKHVIIPFFNTQFELYTLGKSYIDGTMLGLMGLSQSGYLGKKITSPKKTNNSKYQE